ncbi:MAG: DUF2971 domain-containing protein [Desulfobacterales bacterium]|nr:DUF2971 domain-containing protein [Desulfobacterales bacterium]
MFAHYADEHRGFRLKFITDNSLSIGESSVLALGREVIYLDDIPEYSPEKAHEYYYIKSKSWEYESEYRILLASDNIKTYFKGELVEVALGYRFDLTHLPKLKSWVANGCHQNVTFVKAVSSKSKISFEYIKIDV